MRDWLSSTPTGPSRRLLSILVGWHSADIAGHDSWTMTNPSQRMSVPRVVHKVFIARNSALPLLDKHTKQAHESWVIKNPKHRIEYWDGSRCRKFLLDEYPYDVVRAYDRFRPLAYKADLMKYCILFRRGGWYSDWKQVCHEQGFLDAFPSGLLCWDMGLDHSIRNDWLSPALMGLRAGDGLMLRTIRRCVQNTRIGFMGEHAVDPSGPGALGKAFQLAGPTRSSVMALHRDNGFFISGKRVATHKHEMLSQDQDWSEGNNYGNMWKRGRGHVYQTRDGTSPVVVSLTTSPRRISQIKPTIDSILEQSRTPDAVLLNLPHRYARTGELYRLPTFLDDLPVTLNRRCIDLGPATKLLPTIEWLRSRNWPENTRVIAVDDDIVYPTEMVERYMSTDANDAWSMSGLKISEQLSTRSLPTSATHGIEVDILEGCAGVAVTLWMFDSSYREFFKKAIRDHECFISDDVTFAWFLRRNGVRLRFANWPGCNHEMLVHQPYGFEEDALRNLSPTPYLEGASDQFRYSNVIGTLAKNFPLDQSWSV